MDTVREEKYESCACGFCHENMISIKTHICENCGTYNEIFYCEECTKPHLVEEDLVCIPGGIKFCFDCAKEKGLIEEDDASES